jgi:hypothetical protein
MTNNREPNETDRHDDDDDDDVPLLYENETITADDRSMSIDGIFIVTFDVKHGNQIEFQMPDSEHLPLDGVEYKALPSGAHRIHEDFV